ncbi:MAG: AraC family ligand binding domain-containing protein, partial [Victivallales bacterium]
MGQKGTHIYELYSRKQFRHTTLPLSIEMYDYKSTTDKWHRHTDFHELVIVCSGKARNENSRRSEQVHAGHVYLLPSGSVHRYAKLWNFRHYNVLFQPQILDIGSVNIAALPGYSHLFHFQFDGEDRCSPLLSVDETILSQLISMIETVRNEMALRLPGWQEAAYFEFMRMLVHLLRHCVPQNTGIGQSAFQIGRAIRAMEEDCTQQFTLKSL